MDHALRRSRLLDRLEVDALLVTRLVNVRYLTGFTGSSAQLLLRADDPVFLTDGRYEEQSRHEVPDLRRVIYREKMMDALADEIGGGPRLGFEARGMLYDTFRRLEERLDVELVPLTDAVELLRWVKDADEVRLLERAQAVTDEVFDQVIGKLAEGVTERDVALELEHAMRAAGAERVGFDTIVAFGPSAAEPHHHPTDRPLARGDVVKIDFGCVVDGYHSDMTRTVAFGDPGERMREVYEVVRRAQQAGIDAVRAGVEGAEPDRAARELIADAGFGELAHSLGHGVGLEVHEGPTLRKRSEDVLPAGAAVTVEPGIYLPGEGGVRIEDTVIVGDDGCRPLPTTTKELIVL